jgi:hypothetical protein
MAAPSLLAPLTGKRLGNGAHVLAGAGAEAVGVARGSTDVVDAGGVFWAVVDGNFAATLLTAAAVGATAATGEGDSNGGFGTTAQPFLGAAATADITVGFGVTLTDATTGADTVATGAAAVGAFFFVGAVDGDDCCDLAGATAVTRALPPLVVATATCGGAAAAADGTAAMAMPTISSLPFPTPAVLLFLRARRLAAADDIYQWRPVLQQTNATYVKRLRIMRELVSAKNHKRCNWIHHRTNNVTVLIRKS